MAYTTINKASDYFNTKLYTGNGSTNNITGVGFDPDWVWAKSRAVEVHELYDKVRGAGYRLQSQSTAVQNSEGYQSFITDGFAWSGSGNCNANGVSYVSWNWKANGAGSSNTDGSITSTVSANTTAGFSIATYAGNGASSGTQTVGHGLGAVPQVVLQKRATGSAQNWHMYHVGTGNGSALILNDGQAKNTQTDYWGDTTPTSSVVTVGPNNLSTGTNVLYCFTEKTGYSKFGSYKGNGNADGAFVYTGFKPAFVLYKNSTDSSTNWQIHDSARSPYNLSVNRLNANDNSAEVSTTGDSFDILSNGFKARGTASNSNTNASTYIYLAFAERPLVGTNNIPATAR